MSSSTEDPVPGKPRGPSLNVIKNFKNVLFWRAARLSGELEIGSPSWRFQKTI
jgi:hypothetical protein